MKQFEVEVYIRKAYQSNHNTWNYTTGGSWIDQTEFERVEADYYFVDDNGMLDFHVLEEYPAEVLSLYGRLKTSVQNKVRTFHNSQWLSVRLLTEEVSV